MGRLLGPLVIVNGPRFAAVAGAGGRVARLASLPVPYIRIGAPPEDAALTRETITPSESITAGEPGSNVVPGPRTTDEAPGEMVIGSLFAPRVATIGRAVVPVAVGTGPGVR